MSVVLSNLASFCSEQSRRFQFLHVVKYTMFVSAFTLLVN